MASLLNAAKYLIDEHGFTPIYLDEAMFPDPIVSCIPGRDVASPAHPDVRRHRCRPGVHQRPPRGGLGRSEGGGECLMSRSSSTRITKARRSLK